MRVGFSTSDSWISRVIRWVTRSKVSHSYLVFRDRTLDCELVIEATGWHVRTEHHPTFAEKKRIVSEHVVIHARDGMQALREFVVPRFGRRYDVWGALGHLIVAFGRLFGAAWRNPFADPERFMCSELVALWGKAAGISEFVNLDPETVTPEDLRQLVADSSNFQTYAHPKRVSWLRRVFGRRKGKAA